MTLSFSAKLLVYNDLHKYLVIFVAYRLEYLWHTVWNICGKLLGIFVAFRLELLRYRLHLHNGFRTRITQMLDVMGVRFSIA